jgi:nucleoside-diphosphate-sugar epimerase
MKVLVTGATGHIGANLVRELLHRDISVRALVRDDTRAVDDLEVELVVGDLLDAAGLLVACEGVKAVYHLAGRIALAGEPAGPMMEINVNGTRNVVEACLSAGVRRLVHVSSIHALSPEPLHEIVDENRKSALGSGATSYDESKVAADNEVRQGIARGLDVVTIMPTAAIGPNDYKPSRLGEVVRDLARGQMPALVDGGFDWVDARDVALGMIAAMKKGKKGERYILGGHWAKVVELARLVEQFSGVPRPKFVSPMWLAKIGTPFVSGFAQVTGKRPLYTSDAISLLGSYRNVSHRKATDELGYNPRPLEETIKDTVEWFV